MTDDEDIVLVERHLRGDELAFGQLVDRYQESLRRISFTYVRDWQLAEDIAQDVFVRVYENMHRLTDRGAFRGWLFRIAANRSRDELRRRRRRFRLEESIQAESEDVAAGPEADRLATSREIGDAVSEILEGLHERERRPLILKEVEGLKYVEIAEILGCPMGTAQIRIHRARLKIRKELERRGLAPNRRASSSGARGRMSKEKRK